VKENKEGIKNNEKKRKGIKGSKRERKKNKK